MMDNTFLPSTFDATLWVAEWIKTIKEHPEIPTDEGTMLTWFSNLIMAGYDEAMRRQAVVSGNKMLMMDGE